MSSDAFANVLRRSLEGSPPGVLAAWLFGSRARGEEGASSDVDVAILLDREPEAKLGNVAQRLEGELEKALGVRVQVVAVNRAPADLVHRVLRDGQLLLDRDRSLRIRF